MAFDVATGTLDVQVEGGPLDQRVVDVPGWGLDDAITAELESFAAAIRGKAAPFVHPDEALAAVAVVEAAARSISTRAPVGIAPLLAPSST